jgi:hypothetical protein
MSDAARSGIAEKTNARQCAKCGSAEVAFDVWRFSNLLLLPYSVITLILLGLPKTPLPLKCKSCGCRFIGPWTYWP